jgi:hypothetical protein
MKLQYKSTMINANIKKIYYLLNLMRDRYSIGIGIPGNITLVTKQRATNFN